MSNPGMGVMLGMLRGNKYSVEAFNAALGKKIAAVTLDDEANDGNGALRFTFEDGSGLRLYDDAQSCCESRYMKTDDDLSYHVGATLLGADVRNAPSVPDEWGEHEVAFLVVTTSKGAITVETHNEHNGYYGGFWVVAAAEQSA